LKKDNFKWGEEAVLGFAALQATMTTIPVLVMPKFKKYFEIEPDTFGFGLGVVLLIDKQPIDYFSHTFGARAQLKSIYEKELMEIVYAIGKWRPYLLGRSSSFAPTNEV
jgi:hypothetical protein